MPRTYEEALELVAAMKKKALEQAITSIGATPEVLQKIADEGSMHENAIKIKIGQGIVEKELEGWITQEGIWFDVHDSKVGNQTISEVNLSGVNGFYKGNQALLNNHMPTGGFSNSGRFGSFFENVFFGGGAESQPIPDFRYMYGGETHGIEVKATGLKGTPIKKIIDDVKSVMINKINTKFFQHTGGGIKNLTNLSNYITQKSADDERATVMVQAIFLEKWANKLKNLLVAGVSINPISGKVFDKQLNKYVESRGTIFFDALYLFYHLILKKLVDHATANIKIEKNIKFVDRGFRTNSKGEQVLTESSQTIGGAKIITKGGDVSNTQFKLFEVEVLVQASNLPKKEGILRDEILRDPKVFYAGMRILYDNTIANKTAKTFFEESISSAMRPSSGSNDYIV